MKIRLPLGDAYMTAVYAPSGRATCKGCQQKIAKDELRLSNILSEDHYHQELHYHADCFQLKKMFNEATYKDIFHVEGLKKQDQERVSQILEKLKKQQGTSKKQPQKKQPGKNDKKKKQINTDSSDDEIQDVKQKDDKLNKNEQQKQNDPKKLQEQKKKVDSSDDNEDIQNIPEYYVLYDNKQKAEFEKIEQELIKKTAPQLKEMLKMNDQKQTGNKTELIQRIADCKILGCLERCPHCSAGRPKLIVNKKVFKCPGFMDDTEFRFCNKVFQPNELKRIPWRDI